MATDFAITPATPGPGAGSTRTMLVGGNLPLKVRTYSLQFSDNCPTNGEDISDIEADFKSIVGIIAMPTEEVAGMLFLYDRTNSTIVPYLEDGTTKLMTKQNGVDLSTITDLPILVLGY